MTRIILGMLVAAIAVTAQAATPEQLARGQELAETACGACHATGPVGDSPRAEAPAFRALGARYPVDSLQEALAEGIVTGHEAMPQVEWDPDEIDAFLAYLTSIQTP